MSFLESLFGTPIPSINSVEAQKRLKGPKPPLLIDVREPDEYATAHIEGARLTPLGQLNTKLSSLPKSAEVLVICQSGSRSAAATRQLISVGYQAINVSGGMLAWQMARLLIKKGAY